MLCNGFFHNRSLTVNFFLFDCKIGQQISLDVSVLDCVYMLILSYFSITT